jgi:hypothetical protein
MRVESVGKRRRARVSRNKEKRKRKKYGKATLESGLLWLPLLVPHSSSSSTPLPSPPLFAL